MRIRPTSCFWLASFYGSLAFRCRFSRCWLSPALPVGSLLLVLVVYSSGFERFFVFFSPLNLAFWRLSMMFLFEKLLTSFRESVFSAAC